MTKPDFERYGITDSCSRCGRPYAEHPHEYGAECVIPNPHHFRSQPIPRSRRDASVSSDGWWTPDGTFPSWTPS